MRKPIALFLTLIFLLGLAACTGKAPATEPTAGQTAPITTEPAAEETVPTMTEAFQATAPEELVSYQVAAPLEYPDYTFDHAPTTDELRQMAIKAMADMLSVQWSVETYTYYRKTSTGSNKFFEYLPANTYAGLPYSNADGSIVQWFEFYDPETGRIDVGGDGQVLNESIGNTCAGSVCAAWSTVCASIESSCGSANLTPKFGFIPVGGYISIPVDSFNTYSTAQILKDNGQEVMFACYAQIQPADGLTSTPDVHTIMAIEAAHTVYNDDGSIDPDKSYVVIQDQRMGVGESDYTHKSESGNVYFTGRLRAEYSFTELWELGYIPVTLPELVGERPYQQAQVTFSKENCQTLSDLAQGTIVSNYPICVAKLLLTDEQGNETLVERILLDKFDIPTGMARNLDMSAFLRGPGSSYFNGLLKPGKTYTVSVRVSVSTAQVFTPVSFTVTGE